MAADLRPEYFTPFGPSGPTYYLTDSTSAPSSSGDGVVFQVGDHVITSAPSGGNAAEWVCTTGGKGGTAVFKAINCAA